jgi:hypothetical protein
MYTPSYKKRNIKKEKKDYNQIFKYARIRQQSAIGLPPTKILTRKYAKTIESTGEEAHDIHHKL